MDNVIITGAPTQCVPERLNKAELIKQCNYLQDEVMKLSQHVHELKIELQKTVGLANHQHAHLSALVDAHEANDQEAIALQLGQMADRRRSFGKAKVH